MAETGKYGYKRKALDITKQVLAPLDINFDDGTIKMKDGSHICRQVNTHGYVQYKIDGKWYLAHRLIYQALHGDLTPDFFVDHINGNRSDNRGFNLRKVTWKENLRNRTKSFKRLGKYPFVSKVRIKSIRKSGTIYEYWRVQISKNGSYVASQFKTLEEAIKYAKKLSFELHGDRSPYLLDIYKHL